MADGDEKIDHNDRVSVLNRVSDGPVDIMFNGVTLVWKPGEVRSIQAMEAKHFIAKSTVKWDPTETEFPVQKLVIIDAAGRPVEPGASASPLTAAYCKDLAKFGIMDISKLPEDRMAGGLPVMLDPETGERLGNVALRGAPSDVNAPPRVFAPRVPDAALAAVE